MCNEGLPGFRFVWGIVMVGGLSLAKFLCRVLAHSACFLSVRRACTSLIWTSCQGAGTVACILFEQLRKGLVVGS